MQTPDAVIEAIAMSSDRSVPRLADPITRLKALLIDTLILAAAFVGIALIAYYLDWRVPGLSPVTVGFTIADAAWSLGLYLMINVVPMRATGQTWGKRWQGIAVVDMRDNKATLGRQVMRYLLQQIFALFCLISFLNALLIFRKDHRCGHDLIMDTRVIEFP